MDTHAGPAASPKSYSLFDAGPTIFQRDPHNNFGGAPEQIQTNTFPFASKAWKPKRPPKYKGRFYPVIGGREGNCMYKKKKHAMQQAKGVPNASLRAFNLYEKAKEWLDGQLEVDIQWMTPKELAPYTRMSSTSGCDSRECSSDEENRGDGPEHADKTDKVFTVIRNGLGQPVIVCTRYPLPSDVDGGPGNASPHGHFLSYGAAEASLRANRRALRLKPSVTSPVARIDLWHSPLGAGEAGARPPQRLARSSSGAAMELTGKPGGDDAGRQRQALLPRFRQPGEAVPEGKATLFGSTLNVANSVVGAGMLSLPYVLKESSVLVGLAVILFTCAASTYSFYLLGASCELTGKFDYKGLGLDAGGPRLALLIQVVMVLYTAGACIAYAVLLGDFSTGLMSAVDTDYWTAGRMLSTHGSAVTWIGLLVLTPLSCVRDLRHLQHSSTLALVCDVVTAGIILVRAATAPVAPDVNWGAPSPAVFLVTPIVAVACNTHYNAPKFYEELAGRSAAKMGTLSLSSMGIATSIYLLVSVAGYAQFGGATQGDILNCYDTNDGLAILARLSLAFHIALTFPVIFNSTRANIHSLISRTERGAVAGAASSASPMSHKEAAVYAFVLVPPLIAVAANVPEVHEVLAFNGALLGSPIVYSFPAYIYYRLVNRAKDGLSKDKQAETSWLWTSAAPLACLAFGLLMMVTGTVGIVLQKLGVVNLQSSGH
eukprot:jgi/Tetstr1/465839/TSEL_010459.t1